MKTKSSNPSNFESEFLSRLESIELSAARRHVGSIQSVGDGIAMLSGLSDVMMGEILEFPANSSGAKTYGVALNLNSDSVGSILLGEY